MEAGGTWQIVSSMEKKLPLERTKFDCRGYLEGISLKIPFDYWSVIDIAVALFRQFSC